MFKNSYLWLLIAAVLLLSIQILAVVVYIYSFIPLVWDDPLLKGVEPTRDPLFYAIFLGLNVVLMALGVKWVLPKLDSPEMRCKFDLWLGLESLWCFLMMFCFFKWTTYRFPFWSVLPYENSAWLQPFFCVVCALAVLSKIFFPEIDNIYRRLVLEAGQGSFLSRYIIALQVVFIGGMVVLLYIPKPEDVVALAFAWDQWNHLDRVTGWFLQHGWYLSYEKTIRWLVMGTVAYLVGLFYFIRLWLKSWLLAAIGALLAMKMGMFYYGAFPCIWTNPGNSFLAHGWDIFLFFGLWFVSVKYPKKFYAAAALAGIVLVAGWFKTNGYIEALGLDNQPMMAPLRVRQFFPYFMGYFVPVFYVFNLLVLMGQKNAQNASSMRLPVVLCIYGLMIFVNYMEQPLIGFYGSLIVPAILVMLWWLKKIKRRAYAGILLLCIGALLTNRLMQIYPNFIYQDNDRFASEKASYEHFDTNTQSSASLIRQLTKEDQKVVLLSNFETSILMQAHRQPLFKDFPVMYSSFNNNPGGLNLKTKKQCLEMINSMADENALYVFVDARLLNLPPQDLGNSGLNAVLSYLRDHYQGYTSGRVFWWLYSGDKNMRRSNKDIILLSVLACLWAVQSAVILRQLLGLWHAPVLINDMLLPEAVGRMAPKWDLLIYIFFIAAALAAGKIIFKYYHKPVDHWFLIFEGAVTFLMVSAVFKMLVYFNSPQLAQIFLIALIIIAIASKIFYPELKRLTTLAYQRLNVIDWSPYADTWWIAVIMLLIYMPDLERVMAMIFMGESMHHFDFILMSVGWASLWGQVPYVDVISQYGVGLPIIFAKIINHCGGFEYVPALRVMMWFVIIYFILTYFLVRYWLKSALIAGVAFLLIFRLQMFHYGVSPLVWAVPSASPIRFGLDILWMAALMLHMRRGQSRWLILAAIYSGFAVYYMTSVGMCVMVTFYVYLFALSFCHLCAVLYSRILSNAGVYYLCWILPFLSAFLFFGMTLKGLMFQKGYWHNLLDYMDVFPFRASLPMYESLKYRHFWAFFMSMVLPFTYLSTLLYIGVGLYLDKIKKKEWPFVGLLGIYGLCNYQYYVVRAAITSYYVDVLPFVLISCFWFMQGLELLPAVWQKRLRAAAVVLSFYALLTNQNYVAYPNMMNFSRNPMTDNLVIQRFPDRMGYFNLASIKKIRRKANYR